MTGVWAIWEARNKWVFENQRVDIDKVRKRVEELCREFRDEGGVIGTGEESGDIRRQWKKPEDGVVKINVDAGVKEGWGTGIGVVCRGSEGEVLWGLSEHKKEMTEVRMAEAEAMLAGIKEERRRGHTRVVIESDCKPLIDAVSTKAKGRSDFHLMIDDIFLPVLSSMLLGGLFLVDV
ncbi:uncharacterized protein LOC141630760 [Silene latifolia]|uniref:uncharacterized protein LOC141630760 n=1 Tax=Silene latifolia TaxID=37657 RepID=UPI003D7857EC